MDSTTAPTTTAYRATWWHPSGFWTSGRFEAPSADHVHASIARVGGTGVSVSAVDAGPVCDLCGRHQRPGVDCCG